MKRALLINKWVPPDTPPTARLLSDVAERLRDEGWDVDYVGNREGYRNQPKGFLRRLASELGFLLQVFVQGFSRKKRADCILTLTSPAGLIFPAAVVSKLTGTRLLHWCMDLYPDIASALGAVGEKSLISRIVDGLMTWGYRQCDVVVALDQDMADRFRDKGIKAEIQSPWPPDYAQVEEPTTTEITEPSWLYSGNLGKAHEWETLLQAQAILEEKGSPLQLVFQGGGTERELARAAAEELGLKQCLWKDFAEESELITQFHSAEALVVTQKPQTRGMLYPSKLSAFSLTDTPILWVGATDGGIAEELQQRGNSLVAAPREASRIADFLLQLDSGRRGPMGSRLIAFHEALKQSRREGLDRWGKWFEGPS